MAMKDIMKLIGSYFDIPTDSFELQVYDDRFGKYIDFDDEYVEELRCGLPKNYEMLFGQVLFQATQTTNIVSTLSTLL